VSIEPSTQCGRSIDGGAGASVAWIDGMPPGNAATVTQASAQSACDFAGQQGHFGVLPSWWPAIAQ